MWVVLEQFRDAVFDMVKVDAHENTIPLTICIAPDVDAMCACRILTCLLNKFMVQWKLVPVADYAALRELFLLEQAKEMNWILLNCGATRDMTELMSPENHKVFILDAHRPVHLSNIEAAGDPCTIRVLDDGRSKADVERLLGISRHGRSGHRRAKRRALESRGTAEVDDEDDGGEGREEDEESVAGSETPSRLFADSGSDYDDEPGSDGKRRRQVDKEAAREYYKTSHFGCSSAALAYSLAEQVQHRDKEDVLWMGMVGLTDHYLCNKMDADQYNDAMLVLEQEAREQAKLNNRSCTVEIADGVALRNQFHANKIHADEDYRFFLLRHWSLYQSMYHSPVVAARMGLYSSEEARNDLVTLLSRVGINRAKRDGHYKDLSQQEQAALRERLPVLGARFRLRDLTYRAFFKTNGWGWTTSAADLTHAVTALLEEPLEGEGADWRSHFWKAYEALRSSGADDVADGLERAKAMQETIVRQVSLLLHKNCVVRTDYFHYAIFPETMDRGELDVLCQPLTLLRAARFLLEFSKMSRARTRKLRPFVLIAMNHATSHWLVVGVMPEGPGGLCEKNKFGSAFRDAATRSRSNHRYEAFNPAIIAVQKEHLRKFLDALHSRLMDDVAGLI